MAKYRYYGGTYCFRCKREVTESILMCGQCGGKFLYGKIDTVAIREVWVPNPKPFRLWNPTTWIRGRWEIDGFGRIEDGE
jgi:hypothetical protein